MGHAYSSIRLHVVFSTHERRKTIPKELQPRLWAFIAGIARKLKCEVFEIGGVSDHIHCFVAAPATLAQPN